jgi:hypothetical protein
MKFFSRSFLPICLSTIVVCLSFLNSNAVVAQELLSNNLGCTRNLRTILGQISPDYCSSANADSGILFNEFNPKRNVDGSVNLEVTVFNRGSADALVETYDSSKKIKDIQIIDGYRPPAGFIQSAREVFSTPLQLFSRYPIGDSRRTLEEQKITSTIPKGGSVKFTKSDSYAFWYNAAMLALEVGSLHQGDPEFYTTATESKQIVWEFTKEVGSESIINIFKGEANISSLTKVDNLEFIDSVKLSEVLQNLLNFASIQEPDPSKNPILSSFSDASLSIGNYGLEEIMNIYIAPGLGTFARIARVTGEAINTAAKAADLFNSIQDGDSATVTFNDLSDFAPVVDDIKRQLPENIIFRLPSSGLPQTLMATRGAHLSVESGGDYTKLLLKADDNDRFCRLPRGSRGYSMGCIFLSISSSSTTSNYYQNSETRRRLSNIINLDESVTTYLFQGDGFSLIDWVQDSTYFSVYSGTISNEELERLARSMITTELIIK